MNDFLQVLVFIFAAVNPAAAAAAPPSTLRALPRPMLGLGLGIAFAILTSAALLSGDILDGLGVEPETLRVGAGVVFLISGGVALWNGGAPHRGPWAGLPSALFPLALPVLVTPAALAASVTYGEDCGHTETISALAVVLALAVGLLAARAARFEAAFDAVARLTGGLLIVVAAGLVVSGVRAI